MFRYLPKQKGMQFASPFILCVPSDYIYSRIYSVRISSRS